MRRRHGGLGAVPFLVALVAVLLGVGTVVMVTAGGGAPPPAGSTRVGAAGLSQEAVVDEAVATPAVTTTVVPAAVPVPATSTTAPPRPLPIPTLPAPPPTSGVTMTLPPGVVLPPVPTVVPRTPGQLPPLISTWSKKAANGLSVRMHMEPAVPVAGRPVTFVIDELTAPAGCCIVHFQTLDGPVPLATTCRDSASRAGLSHAHTFAEAGVHTFLLVVLTTSCPDGQGAGQPTVGLSLQGCVVVGPDADRSKLPIPTICGG